eukprot:scaffold823_cov397-Prasinococcus_capsulatus_cf.AAC.4
MARATARASKPPGGGGGGACQVCGPRLGLLPPPPEPRGAEVTTTATTTCTLAKADRRRRTCQAVPGHARMAWPQKGGRRRRAALKRRTGGLRNRPPQRSSAPQCEGRAAHAPRPSADNAPSPGGGVLSMQEARAPAGRNRRSAPTCTGPRAREGGGARRSCGGLQCPAPFAAQPQPAGLREGSAGDQQRPPLAMPIGRRMPQGAAARARAPPPPGLPAAGLLEQAGGAATEPCSCSRHFELDAVGFQPPATASRHRTRSARWSLSKPTRELRMRAPELVFVAHQAITKHGWAGLSLQWRMCTY